MRLSLAVELLLEINAIRPVLLSNDTGTNHCNTLYGRSPCNAISVAIRGKNMA
jgi:hypothetical protein